MRIPPYMNPPSLDSLGVGLQRLKCDLCDCPDVFLAYDECRSQLHRDSHACEAIVTYSANQN